MISDLLDNDKQKHDVVVHSKHLQLLPKKSKIKIRNYLENNYQGNYADNRKMGMNGDGMQKTVDWEK